MMMEAVPAGAASSAPVLEARGVSKRYGDREALRGVDIAVSPGVVHGLLGPNGAGKSTLLRILLGLVRPDTGTVRLCGHACEGIEGPLPAGVAGFVDTPAFYPFLSGRRNLALLTRLDDDCEANPRVRIARALEDVGLGPFADAAVGGYSAGMRQRLGLAAALVRAPRLLFLDEPTSSLDPAGVRDVRALVRRLADAGAAIIFSSHDMSEVEELCEVITVISFGRVVFSGTLDTLRRLAPATLHVVRTSDDAAALALARLQSRVKVTATDRDGGLEVTADQRDLDAYVIALGRAGVAVRVLERRARSLESLFLELTERGLSARDL